jgi:ABC-type iron transport system FetAB permease component
MPDDREEVSLDLVQRVVISVLVIVVVGSISAVLAAYLAFNQTNMNRVDTVGLWVMTGVIGLATSVAVLVINRRRPYSPLVLLGLIPMAITGYLIFR